MCRPRLLADGVRREEASNVTNTSGKRGRGVMVSGWWVRSGSAMLGDVDDRLGTAEGGDIDVKWTGCSGNTEPHLPLGIALGHMWLAVSSAADQRRNQNSVGVGKLGYNQDQSIKFWDSDSG